MARKRSGFTLIELLIVVVIIGLLAAIAIPKFNNTKGKAYWAAMRSDLRNLATAEENYFYINQSYAPSLAALDYAPTSGVTVTLSALPAGTPGWSATATHPLAWPVTCAIFVGGAPALAPATTEGAVGCSN